MTAYHNITVELKQDSIEDKTPIYIQNGMLLSVDTTKKAFMQPKCNFIVSLPPWETQKSMCPLILQNPSLS